MNDSIVQHTSALIILVYRGFTVFPTGFNMIIISDTNEIKLILLFPLS